MKLTFLGTAAGSVAVGDRRQSSLLLESGCGVYWFDAGEGCTGAAYAARIDLLSTRAVFLSHMAMDHIAGLPRLLWTIRKLDSQAGANAVPGGMIRVYIPDVYAWSGMMEMLEATTRNRYAKNFVLEISRFHDGPVYRDEDLRVLARHNHHLGVPNASHGWRSFGFRAESGGRALAYSGDVEELTEILPLLETPVDLLALDCGHCGLSAVTALLRENRARCGRVALVHLDRRILAELGEIRRQLAAEFGDAVWIPDDGETVEV